MSKPSSIKEMIDLLRRSQVVDDAKNPEPCPEVWVSEIDTQFPESGFPYFPTTQYPESPVLNGKDDASFLRFRPGTLPTDVEARIGMIIGTAIPLPPLPPEPIAK